MNTHTNTKVTTGKKRGTPKGRKFGYNPNRFKQEGDYINITAVVTPRIHTLVKTEAAINNKSVSGVLFDILEQRYRLVD